MIDLDEDLIDLRQVCREKPFRNPRTGKPAHISSAYRFILRGARASNGERVKLETIRTPRGLRTSREAITRFIASLTDPAAPPLSNAARKRQQQRAEAELIGAGFEIGGEATN
jgi:hypothetical protein